MQQTEKYKLNLIETSDTFSPEALNQNTQKVENALTAHEAAVGEVTDALLGQNADLDSRVTALEAHKIYWGTYQGDGTSSRTIKLGFTPKVLLVSNGSVGQIGLAVGVNAGIGWNLCYWQIVNGGFKAVAPSGANDVNYLGMTYFYLALM